MLDDAPDVKQRRFRKVAVAFTKEHRLAVFPDRLVAVHAGAVITEYRFGHEGGRLAVAVCYIVDDMLVKLDVVGTVGQGRIFDADFALGGGNFVVVFFNAQAHALHDGDHFAADVGKAVDGGIGKVSSLDAGAVARVAFGIIPAAIVVAFGAVDLKADLVHVSMDFHVLEDKELRFGAEIGVIANP